MKPAGFFKLRPLDLDLGDVIVQVVAVALGVILGFAVTSWNERAHQRALLRETVATIVGELRSNQAGMREVTAEHAKSFAILRQLVGRASATPTITFADARAALRNTGNFRENVPLSIAWQIAQTDQGLTLLPFDDRYDVAWIYQVQTLYYEREERYESSLVTLTESPSGNYFLEVADLANQLQAVVATERRLDELYTNGIAHAKKEFKI
ncbi:MAG: hypothetical protein IAI50_14165 [Candidatus Eremiobacteraeota bacterium]|nr:hypothetical protein [Candidatus Eremiobacteraeota bacterium]